ncbi:MAG: hypothetical protein AAF802_09285 [Planctomycetota bacterium]
MLTEEQRRHLEILVARSIDGQEEATKEIREILWDDRETWRPFGSLKRHVEQQFLDLMTRGDVLLSEAVRMDLAEKLSRLKAASGNPVLQLAADHLMLCHIDTHYHQMLLAEARGSQKELKSAETRLSVSSKRYKSAIKSYALVEQLVSGSRSCC